MTDIKAIALKSDGDEKVRAGNYQGAIKSYLDAVLIDPRYLQAWNNLGYCFSKMGKTEEENQVRNKIREITQQMQSGEIPGPAGEPRRGEPLRRGPATRIPTPDLYLAGPWDRWFAYILDFLLVFLILLIAAIPLVMLFPNNPSGMFFIFIPLILVVSWLYFAVFEAGDHEATPGKRALKIFVTDDYGKRLSLGHSLGRSFFKILLTLSPFSLLTLLNGIVISSSARSKGLHDHLAHTIVVTKKVTDKTAFSSEATQKSSSTILLILIAILLLIGFIVMAAIIAAFVFGMAGSGAPVP